MRLRGTKSFCIGSSTKRQVKDFSPLDLPGIVRWYDASDASTVTLVGSKVSQWDDKTPNAQHLTQNTDSNRYIYSTASVNGLNSMLGGGPSLDQHMLLPGLLDLTATGWAVAISSVVIDKTYSVLGNRVISPLSAIGYYNGSSENVQCLDSYGNSISGLGTGMRDELPNCFVFRNNATALTLFWNGANIATGTWGISTVIQGSTCSPFNLGLDLGCRLCEIMLGIGSLTDSDVASIETYAESKWGVTP